MKITLKPSVSYALAGTFALALIIYSFGLSGPFIYDDLEQIVQQSNLHNIWAVKKVIFNGVRQIRLWQNLTFALNWSISPNQTWSFKLFNLVLHLLNSFVLWCWLRRCLPRQVHLAALATGLFLLHPLQIQSIVYVMGRTSLLQGFFYFLSLWWITKYSTRRIDGLIVILIASLFAKETCVLIPPLLLLYELLVNQTPLKKLDWRRWALIFAIPFLYIPIYFILKDPKSMYEATTGFQLYPFNKYVFSQFYFLTFYLILFLYSPFQSIIHSFPSFTPVQTALAVLGEVIFLIMMVTTLRGLRRAPVVSFFVLFFCIAYLPTNSVFQMINPFAEYRLYLGNSILCLFLAFVIDTGVGHFFRNRKAAVAVASVPVLAIFSYFTYNNAITWRDSVAVYQQGVRNYPTEYALHNNLGVEYINHHLLPEALVSFAQARKYYGSLPSFISRNFYVVAGVYFNEGEYDKAWAIVRNLEADPAREFDFPKQFYDLKFELLKNLKVSKN